MNSLKTLFVSAVLVAVLYGVYLAMNHAPKQEPPLEVAAAWNGDMNIEPGTPVQSPSIMPGKKTQARAPVAKTPFARFPSAGGTKFVPAPKMTMNFSIPGDASKPALAKPADKQPAKQGLRTTPGAKTVAKTIAPLEAAPRRPLAAQTTLATAGKAADRQIAPNTGPPSPRDFAAFMSIVRGELDRGRLLDAYRMLSGRYRDPQFTPDENRRVEHLLDQLAGTIVYSRQHFTERPHRVGPNETLDQIARRYNVPPRLLAKINGIAPSGRLNPGSELKVVNGPFTAEIDLIKRELTLRLPDGGYAGRFPVAVGRNVPEINKAYRVYDKIAAAPSPGVNQAGYSPNTMPKQKWIGLGGRLGIHAAGNPADIGRSGTEGGISLRARDVDDLYDILSVGSRVVIRR